MAIVNGTNLYIAALPKPAGVPTAAPTLVGVAEVYALAPGNLHAPSPVGTRPIYHADTSGPALPAGTVVAVALSNGGKAYITAAPGYYQGLSPAGVNALFSGF